MASKRVVDKLEEPQITTSGDSEAIGKAPQKYEEIQSLNDAERFLVENEPPSSPLQYAPLAAGEIRVLTITPGQRPAPVVVSLERTTLSVDANYNALSYTWGDQTNKKAISCYGESDYHHQNLCHLHVTESCFKALHRLRHATEPRRYWIDAICINQEDLQERNSQVQLMGEVYKCAEAVHIYIVEEDVPDGVETGGEEAVGVIRRLSNKTQRHLDRLTPAVRASLVKLVGRSWFTRAWIMQEIFNAKHHLKTRLICGEHELKYNQLHHMAWARRLQSDRFEDAAAIWPGVFRVNDYESYRSDSEDFVHLLAFTRGCKATDARDKVYALLPMLEDWDKSALPVDYTMEVEDLYLRFARYLACRSPSILAAVDHQAGEGLEWRESYYNHERQQKEGERDFKLPSWAPDWRQEQDGVPIWPTPVGGWQETAMTYCAGGENKYPLPEILTLPQASQSDQELDRYPVLALRVRGVQIGRITAIDPEIMKTSLLDLAVPGSYSNFRRSWFRMQMAWGKEGPQPPMSIRQLALFEAAIPTDLETDMESLNLNGDADDDDSGNRDEDAHPIEKSLNDALVWPRWKEIQDIAKKHQINDIFGIDDDAPHRDVHYITETTSYHSAFTEEIVQELAFDVVNLVNGRRIFVSDDGGRMGVAPVAARNGDVLCIIYGVPIPLVLRPLGGGELAGEEARNTKYLLVGGCYVNGLMQKDAIDKVRARRANAAGGDASAGGDIEDIFDVI